jgi:hypothetical protein
MIRKTLLAVASLAFVATAGVPAYAAPCRDAKGKFIKCADKKPAPKRCKNAKRKFAKCGTPGAKPA